MPRSTARSSPSPMSNATQTLSSRPPASNRSPSGVVTGATKKRHRLFNERAIGHVSTTVLEGRVTQRLCVNSFRTTPADAEAVLAQLLGPLP